MNNDYLSANFAVLFLTCLDGIGNKTAKRILSRLTKKYPDKVKQQSFQLFDLIDLLIEMNLLNESLMPIAFIRKARLEAQKIISACEDLGIKMINCTDPSFPKCLMGDDGPVLIYYRGDLSILSNPNRAAVIGTRKPTRNGFAYAHNVGRLLAEADFTVISGLALGCDTAGHKGCLEAGGKTIAFLPAGLNHIYPKSNRDLAKIIVESGGCLVSEYAPDEPDDKPQNYGFIQRDRLQAMSANIIFCSEFDAESGTLHTLKYANTYGVPIVSSQSIINSPSFADDTLKALVDIPLDEIPDDEMINYLQKIQKR